MSLELIKKDIKIDEKTGCWNWQKSLSSSGYGQKMINGIRHNSLHRYVFSLSNKIESHEVVRHKCHNRKCCNPDHLEKGSRKDNYHDSVDVHKKASKAQRKLWICNDIYYETQRDMMNKTGMSSPTILKHMREDRTFDIEKYRENCIKNKIIPRV